MYISLVFLSVVALVTAKSAISSKPSRVVNVTDKTFDEMVEGPCIFIRFFASWCPDCSAFTEHWQEVARKLGDLCICADVDCAKDEKLCDDVGIKHYATYQLVVNGSLKATIAKHETGKKLVKFAKKEIPKYRSVRDVAAAGILEVAAKDFEMVAASSIATVAIFWVPWCPHCRQTLSILSKLHNLHKNDKDIQFIKVDCDKDGNNKLCFEAIGNGVPTVHMYCNKTLAIDDYHGSTLEEYNDMVASNCKGQRKHLEWETRDKARRAIRRQERRKQLGEVSKSQA